MSAGGGGGGYVREMWGAEELWSGHIFRDF